MTDPDLVGGNAICKNYYYSYGSQPARGSSSGCSEIQWTGGDTVRGPLHSNDALQINGPVNFTDPRTESSWPALNVAAPPARSWWTTTSQGPPLAGFSPKYAAPLSLPAGNSELLQQVEPDVDGDGAVGSGLLLHRGHPHHLPGHEHARVQPLDHPRPAPRPGASTWPTEAWSRPSRSHRSSTSTGRRTAARSAPSATRAPASSTPWARPRRRRGHRSVARRRPTTTAAGARRTCRERSPARSTIAARDDVVVTDDLTLAAGPRVRM